MTLIILLLTVALSYSGFKNESLLRRMIFNPYLIKHNNEWHRFITSGFIHADWMHLLVNVFVFYSFGGIIEEYYNQIFGDLSKAYFTLLYFGGMVCASVPTFVSQVKNPGYNALGASGAVASMLFSYILFQPVNDLCLYGIFCVPGIILGIGYLVYSWYEAKKGRDHINHSAHFWGALYGVLFNLVAVPQSGDLFIEQLRMKIGL